MHLLLHEWRQIYTQEKKVIVTHEVAAFFFLNGQTRSRTAFLAALVMAQRDRVTLSCAAQTLTQTGRIKVTPAD